MTEIVTLDEAKLFCRIEADDTDEDATLATLIGAASEAVLDMAESWDGSVPVPDRIKLAVLTRVAIAFDNREAVGGAKDELRLLGPLRGLGV